jgi:hypothetical protein
LCGDDLKYYHKGHYIVTDEELLERRRFLVDH